MSDFKFQPNSLATSIPEAYGVSKARFEEIKKELDVIDETLKKIPRANIKHAIDAYQTIAKNENESRYLSYVTGARGTEMMMRNSSERDFLKSLLDSLR